MAMPEDIAEASLRQMSRTVKNIALITLESQTPFLRTINEADPTVSLEDLVKADHRSVKVLERVLARMKVMKVIAEPEPGRYGPTALSKAVCGHPGATALFTIFEQASRLLCIVELEDEEYYRTSDEAYDDNELEFDRLARLEKAEEQEGCQSTAMVHNEVDIDMDG